MTEQRKTAPAGGAGSSSTAILPEHEARLQRESGLTPETIRAAGLWSATREDVSRLVGFDAGSGGIVFPYPGADGFCRIRLDRPYQAPGWPKPAKYLTPPGAGNRLYIPPNLPPGTLEGTGPLVITEGERKALRGCQDGIPCIATAGVWSWKQRGPNGEKLPDQEGLLPDFGKLRLWGRKLVVLVYDSDIAPQHEAWPAYNRLARELRRRGVKQVKVLTLPALPEVDGKVGLDDFLLRRAPADFWKLVAAAPEWEARAVCAEPVPPPVELPEEARDVAPASPEPQDRESQATRLVRLGRQAELWHTPEREPYATLSINGHREIMPLRSRLFRDWLSRRFYEEQGKAPGGQALEDALNTLRGDALFSGPEHPVYVRVAAANGRLYLDLADEAWRALEIGPDGWRVTQDPPVCFRRARGMLPLPVPEPGGDLALLRKYVNLPEGTHDSEWILLVGWLVGTLHPTGPYPILILQGEQGSGKSFAARLLRALVDPNVAALRTIPREERDLMIAARNGWVVAFDNLSGLAAWLSDALCRLSTGGGFATRELYQDTDEILIDARRPVIVNGIDELAERDDLRDRAIIVTLPPIPEQARREESKLWRDFETNRPRILGALLDGVSTALARMDSVRLDRLPRMADFARWVVAAEPALPWEQGDFLKAYSANRQAAAEAGITDNPLAQAVVAVAQRGEYSGIARDLLKDLAREVDEHTVKSRIWPASPKALANRLRRLAPALRLVGVNVKFEREAGTGRRLIKLGASEQGNVTNVTTVTAGEKALSPNGLWCDVSCDLTRPGNGETSRERHGQDACDCSISDDCDGSDVCLQAIPREEVF